MKKVTQISGNVNSEHQTGLDVGELSQKKTHTRPS